MRKLKYFKQIAVAIIIATLLCDKGTVITNAAEIVSSDGKGNVSANNMEEESVPAAVKNPEIGKTEGTEELEGTEGVDYASGEVILVLEDAGIATLSLEGIEEEIV